MGGRRVQGSQGRGRAVRGRASRRSGFAKVAALLSLSFVTAVQARDLQGDFLYLSGQMDHLSTASGGGGGGLEWVVPTSPRAGVSLGGYSFSLAGGRWSYGKAGGYFKPGERTAVYGEADRGAGRQSSGRITYEVYKAGLTQALAGKRVYADVENNYIHIGDTEENLVRVGLILQPSPALGVRLNHNFSTSGSVGSRFASGRFDWDRKRIKLLGGLTIGRTTPERFNLLTTSSGAVRSREFFAGVSIPAGGSTMTLVLDNLRLPDARRYTLSVGWKLPLEKSFPRH